MGAPTSIELWPGGIVHATVESVPSPHRYVMPDSDRSAVHLAVARVWVALVALVQVWSHDFPGLSASGLRLERLLATAFLLAAAAGWRLGLSALAGAALLAVMALTGSGATTAPLSLLPAAVLLIPIGVFAADQEIGVDAWRRTGDRPLGDLNAFLRGPVHHVPPDRLLRWLGAGLGICLAWIVHAFWTSRSPAPSPEVALLAAVLAPWNRMHARRSSGEPVTVIYDENCFFCARTLTLFKNLDVHHTIDFRPRSDVPGKYQEVPGVDPRVALVLFREEESFVGYHAFRAMLGQFAFTGPAVWVMGWPPVVELGEAVYARIAANRTRWFACAASDDEPEGGS